MGHSYDDKCCEKKEVIVVYLPEKKKKCCDTDKYAFVYPKHKKDKCCHEKKKDKCCDNYHH